MKWTLTIAACTLALILLFSSPSVAQKPFQFNPDLVKAAQKEGTVVVYTTTRRRVMDEISKVFEKKFGIRVDFTRKPTGAIVQMVTAQKMAGKIRFDVISTGDESIIQQWLKKGILVPYKPNTANLIPDTYHKSDQYINYRFVSLQVVVYSSKRISPEKAPKDWDDLLDPRWKGRIAIADPNSAGGTRTLVRLMVDKLGWGYFRKLAENEPLLVRSQASLIPLVLSGEADIVFSVAGADAVMAAHKGEPIKVLYPKPFTLALWLNSAVAKDAPHPNAARLWQDFSLTADAQKVYAAQGYYTTNPEAPPRYNRPRLEDIKTFTVNPVYLHKTEKKMLHTFTQIMEKARR